MVGTLGPQYSESNANLQAAINEALLELRNTRSSASLLLGAAAGVDLPGAPIVDFEDYPVAPVSPNAVVEDEDAPDAPEDEDAPDAPEDEGEEQLVPTAPLITYPADINFTPVNPEVAKPRFPAAPPLQGTSKWARPNRPNEPFQFKQFFTGTPDTPEEVIDRANDAVAAWVEAYFPAINECFADQPEQWVCDVISGIRPLGNSEQAIDIAWTKAKANEVTQLRSERATITSEFASRGFTMPPGVMVAQLRRSQERFSDAAAGVNREAALADVRIQSELLQLAVTVGADLKRGMAGVMAQFFNTVAGVQDRASETANERARIVAGAEAQFLSALTAYESVNQEHYRALNNMKLDESRVSVGAYSAKVGAVTEATRAEIQTAQFKLDAARQALDAAVATSQAGNQSAQTKADVYRAQTDAYGTVVSAEVSKAQLEANVYGTDVSAYGTKVSAEVTKAQLEVSVYEANVNALINKAELSTSSGAGTALSGVARAFGDVAGAAAAASGTLVAQIEDM